jgi:hypothetical protein
MGRSPSQVLPAGPAPIDLAADGTRRGHERRRFQYSFGRLGSLASLRGDGIARGLEE